MMQTRLQATTNTFLQYAHRDVILPRWHRQFNSMSGLKFLDVLRVDAVEACHHAVMRHGKKADHLSLVGFFKAEADFLVESEGGATYSQRVEFRVKRESADVALEDVEEVYVRLEHEGANVKKKYIGHHISGNDLIRVLQDQRAENLISPDFLRTIQETIPVTRQRTIAVYDAAIAAHCN